MKVLLINNKEAAIYMPGKPVFKLYSGDGQVVRMIDEFLCPIDQSNFNTLSEYNLAVKKSLEDTNVIQLPVVNKDYEVELMYANLCM